MFGGPFHYTVMSYDERGRVEAILRCTENIGFDAVYYRYNSMNLVTSVTTSDALRSHTTWYGYDHQGRVDSVWTTLGPVGSGLIPEKHLPPPGTPSWPIIAMAAPQDMQMRAPQTVPDITYDYTKLGQVSAMRYPPANVLVEYAYNQRKWLTSLVARDTSSTLGMIFREQLSYDSTGQITEQRYKHGGGSEQVQTYGYDSTDRLTWWTQNGGIDTVGYSYDAVGNRTNLRRSWDLYPENYSIIAGRNQLELRKHHDAEIGDTLLIYEYNRNGSLTRRRMQHDSSTGAWTNWPTWPKPSGIGQQFNEELRYSYRNLLNRVWHTDSSRNSYDWRYRYSASGEREQKRLVRFVPWIPPVVTHPIDTPRIAGGWVYYLLGAHNEQLAVYHGQQDTGNVCNDTAAGVSMYPTEYLTHGVGYTGVHEDVSQVITDASGNKQYRISDHLATLRATVDGSGISGYDSDPWGGTLAAPVTDGSRRVFNDREKDKETGNLSLGVRSEEPEIGRFLSVDPLWEKFPGQSAYIYANNNPLRFTDPEGMQGVEMTPGRMPVGYQTPGVLPYPNFTPEAFRILLHDIGAAIQRVLFSPRDSPSSSRTDAPANSRNVPNSPAYFTVRRFMSKDEMKEIKKNGLKFDASKTTESGGIPTTTRNFNPRNQEEVRRRLGARRENTEYQVDLDVTGIQRGPDKITKTGLPEYVIRGDVPKERIISITRVPK